MKRRAPLKVHTLVRVDGLEDGRALCGLRLLGIRFRRAVVQGEQRRPTCKLCRARTPVGPAF